MGDCYLCKGPTVTLDAPPDTISPHCWTALYEGRKWQGCAVLQPVYKRRRVRTWTWETYEATPVPIRKEATRE